MIKNNILRKIRNSGIIKNGDSILAGVSGGTDSTALLLILKALSSELKLKIFAAHLNHKIRGKESDADEKFVKALAKKLRIPVFTESFNVLGFAKRNRLNLEDAARRIRYEFFERAAVKMKANKIAVAHTADDNIETFLMRLIRGAGLKGLEGIPAERGNLIRPLLTVYRTELEEYLKAEGVKPRVDRSNFDTKYLRSSIRHELIPTLARYNPNIKEGLLRTIGSVNEDSDLIDELSKKAYGSVNKKSGKGRVSLDVKGLLSLKPALRAGVVKLAVARVKKDLNDLTYVNILDILDIAAKHRAQLHIPGAFVEKSKGILTFSLTRPMTRNPREFLYRLEVPGIILIKESGYEIVSELIDIGSARGIKKKDPNRAYLDRDKISGALMVRSRRRGDSFTPLGMKGTKKLQDIFVDEKIDPERRDMVPVIDDGKKIVWVAGFRIADDVKIDKGTKKVIELYARRV